MSKGRASSFTAAGPSLNRCKTARRVGSPSAWNTRSSAIDCLGIYLSIGSAGARVNRADNRLVQPRVATQSAAMQQKTPSKPKLGLRDGSIGRTGFVERFGLASAEKTEQAATVAKLIATKGIETVRLSFADQHGLLRGKTLVAGEVPLAMKNGCAITTTLLAKDTAHRT